MLIENYHFAIYHALSLTAQFLHMSATLNWKNIVCKDLRRHFVVFMYVCRAMAK